MAISFEPYYHTAPIKKTPAAPWAKYYSPEDLTWEVPESTIYRFFEERAMRYRDAVAIEYFGTKWTYEKFFQKIQEATASFKMNGVRRGDVVTILSANVPEALVSFYALNRIGAVVNFLHPLLSENEILHALEQYESVMLVALDICYTRIKNILSQTQVYKTVILSAKDSMPLHLKAGYNMVRDPYVEKPKAGANFVYWADFIKSGRKYEWEEPSAVPSKNMPAVILQSGGTTGTPKGIVLSNGNFNAATIQALRALPDLNREDVILGIMPIFHGFGLEVSINDAFCVGAKVVLIPQFNAKHFDKLVRQHKPTVLVGVPTLFEAMTSHPGMEKADLSNLKYVIAGGDSFSEERVRAINDFLHAHGATTNFTQGFGMTEAVAAITFDRKDHSKEGTVGIPWPGTYVKICEVGTTKEVPTGQEGEICICGPTVMLGYYGNEEETNETLRKHKDGNVWLHSGDIGWMDEDGFVTFTQRIKRMIVSSGYNVFPARIEALLTSHPAVKEVCVIGVPHPYKVEVAKAFLVLHEDWDAEDVLSQLKELCKKNMAVYAVPRQWELREELPKTMVGKVDYRALEEEERVKREAEEESFTEV